MQDSLCGSINLGAGGGHAPVPRSSSQISFLKDIMISDAPPSPLHRSFSSSDMAPSCDTHVHLHSETAIHSSSSCRGDQNMPSLTNHEWPHHHDKHQTYPMIPDVQVAAQESPDSPNSSYCWISDMIDELTEAPLHDSPMLCSPSHESSTLHTFTSSYSSFSDNFNDRQDLSGSPSIVANTPTQLPICEEDIESPNSSHQFHGADHFSSQHMKLGLNHDINRKAQAPSYGHDHIMQAQHQHQRQHESSQKKPESKTHLSQYNAGQRTMMQAKFKLPIGRQHSNAIQKALSAPQLNKLDPTKSPRWSSPLQLPLAPHQAMPLKKSNALQMSRAEYGGFLKRNSMFSSATRSSLCSPDSPPRSLRPSSLPSQMGYLSHRVGPNAACQMQPHAHPQGRPPSLHWNTSPMPPTASFTDNSRLRETMAPLQQSSNLPMLQHLPDMQQHDSGLRLVHLLLACAEAVAKESYFEAKEILLHLKQVVSKKGDSMQRVAAYFTDALHSRLTGTGSRSYMALRSFNPATDDDVLVAYQILYQACPYVKFAHFTSNQAIFEAFEEEKRVHIVDLDIIQGYQWPAFIQALAARPGGAPRLRITGVGIPFESVQETGKRLSELAESLHVPFEFHPVGERLENLKSHMLQRRMGEALAINSVFRLHRLLSEPMSPLFGVLHMLREQAPSIFTLVEFEASHNGPFFLGRFLEALHYYSAIFDSLDSTLPQTSPERAKVEQLVFSHEITNIVACEGGERVERHERLEKWRKMMEGMGFENVALSPNAVNQSKLLLGLYPCDGYTLVEDRGGLLLGWQERPVIAASAWR